MFFDRLSEACSMHGTSPSAVAIQIGRSKSNVTGWKKGQIPSSDTVTAIADVLQVPTDFLLERPPFDCWELINQNRKGFLHYVDIMPETLKLIWGIDPENPEAAPTEHFIRFLQNVVSEVRATEDGDWVIALKEPVSYTHLAAALCPSAVQCPRSPPAPAPDVPPVICLTPPDPQRPDVI